MISFNREKFLKDRSKVHFSIPFRDSEISFVSDTPTKNVVEDWGGDACFYFIEVDIEKFIPMFSEYSQFVNNDKNFVFDRKTTTEILRYPQNIEEIRKIEKQFIDRVEFEVPIVSIGKLGTMVWPHMLMLWLIANGVKHCPVKVNEKSAVKKLIKECGFGDKQGMCAVGTSRGTLPSGKISQVEVIPLHKDSYHNL